MILREKTLAGLLLVISFGLVAQAEPSAAVREMSLAQAIQGALQNNNDVLAAGKQVDHYVATKRVARAAFLPQVRAEAGYTYLKPAPEAEINLPLPPPLGPRTNTLQMGFEDNRKLSLVVQQNIFAWGGDLAQYRAAELGISIAELNLEQARQTIAYETAKAFHSIVLLRRQEALLAQVLKQKESHSREVASNFNSGVATELERLQTEVAFETVRPELTNVRNRIQLTELNLKNLIGLSHAENVNWKGDLALTPVAENLPELVNRALGKNKVLQIDDSKSRMLSYQIESAAARDKPTLSVGGKYDYTNPFNLKQEWGSQYSVFATLSWTIFDGLVARSKSAELISDRGEVDYRLKAAREQVSLGVRSAFLNAKNAEERARSFERAVALAEKAYHIARVGYDSGTVTNNSVLEADVGLTQTKLSYLQAVYDQILAKLDMERSVGTILESLGSKSKE